MSKLTFTLNYFEYVYIFIVIYWHRDICFKNITVFDFITQCWFPLVIQPVNGFTVESPLNHSHYYSQIFIILIVSELIHIRIATLYESKSIHKCPKKFFHMTERIRQTGLHWRESAAHGQCRACTHFCYLHFVFNNEGEVYSYLVRHHKECKL